MATVIRNKEDIEKLKFGDMYVIEIEGMPGPDSQDPNPSQKVITELDELQAAIEEKFKRPTKEEVEDFNERMKLSENVVTANRGNQKGKN